MNRLPLSRSAANTGTARQAAPSTLISFRDSAPRRTGTPDPEIFFQPRVFHPEFVRLTCLDRDRGGHAPEARANERETGFAFANGALSLSFKKQNQSR